MRRDADPRVTQEFLRDVFEYNAETGELVWRKRRGTANAGQVAGYVKADKYRYIRLFSKDYGAHRLIWLYIYGHVPHEIDHKDRDKTNNRLSNLRPVSRKQNMRNTKEPSSGFKGAYLMPSGKFKASIWVDGTVVPLGLFSSPVMAGLVYRAAHTAIFNEDGDEEDLHRLWRLAYEMSAQDLVECVCQS